MIDMESQLNLAFLLGKQHSNLKYVCRDMIGQLNNIKHKRVGYYSFIFNKNNTLLFPFLGWLRIDKGPMISYLKAKVVLQLKQNH